MPVRLVSRRAAPLTPMDDRWHAQRGRSDRTRTTPARTASTPPTTHGQASCDTASDGSERSLADAPDVEAGGEADADSAAIARPTSAGSLVATTGAWTPSDER